MTEQELFKEIKSYNEHYRKGDALIEDYEYDLLVEQLRAKNPNHEWFQSIEPGIETGKKEILPVPMKSLDKVKTIEGIWKWLSKIGLDHTTELCIMPKYDGMSILVEETTGKAWTRGGKDNEGQVKTEHFKRMLCVNNSMFAKYTFGEIIFPKSRWKHIVGKTSESGTVYKVARNTVCGLFNSDNISKYLEAAEYVRYGVGDYDGFVYFHELLSNMNYTYSSCADYVCCKARDISHEYLQKIYDKFSKEFEIDGLVVYVNEIPLWNRIGRHESTGNPQYAIAYKGGFDDKFKTVVREINVNVSKNGYLRPTVSIDPVYIGGAKVENPTGNNYRFLVDNKICPGAAIEVIKSGAVIPKIIDVLSVPKEIDLSVFDKCPACGEPTVLNKTKTDMMCTNPNCDGIQLAKVIHFYNIMGCDGIGDGLFTILSTFGIKSLRDVLNANNSIMDIDGIGRETFDILNSINMRILTEDNSLAKLIHASDCFEGIGESKALKLIDELEQLHPELLMKYITGEVDAFDVQLKGVTGINFVAGIHKFKQFLKENNLPVSIPKKQEVIGDKWLNEKVCFSGVRDKSLEETIKSEGGQIVSGVTGKTTILIVKDKTEVTSKITSAKKLGIKILNIGDIES